MYFPFRGTENGPYVRMPAVSKYSFFMAVITLASLVLMGALDFFTGQEMVFSCAYLVPVCLAAWWIGRRWMIVMAIMSGITALLVDKFDGYEYAHPGIEYWNAFTCFLISIVTGWMLCRLKRTLVEKQTANDRLRFALRNLEASTLEIRKLQSGLQTVCAWTNQIKVGEGWMTPEEFLRTQLHLELTHGISPDAFREMASGLAKIA